MRKSKKKILLYSLLLKWYLEHGSVITAVYKIICNQASRPFEWFVHEVSNTQREGDTDLQKNQLGDTFKLKGNSFYGKMIENLGRYSNTKFTTDIGEVDKSIRNPFLQILKL